MKPRLSVIIPCHHDAEECALTVKSIRETAPDAELIIVDDCSPNRLFIEDKDVRLFHNSYRCGAGASRHFGVLAAKGEFVLLCDAHMRFEKGWYEDALRQMAGKWKTVYCGVCLGFTRETPPFGTPDGKYFGADFDFEKFDGVWAKERPDDAQLPCLMGACYFMPRDWYLKIGGLQFLRGWGSEEMALSLKTWMAGGEIRLMKNVRIWHRFRKESMPYTILTWHTIYNKLFLIQTILPAEAGYKLISAMPKGFDYNMAAEAIRNDWHLVTTERMRNQLMFSRSFEWLCKKFDLVV